MTASQQLRKHLPHHAQALARLTRVAQSLAVFLQKAPDEDVAPVFLPKRQVVGMHHRRIGAVGQPVTRMSSLVGSGWENPPTAL